MSAADPRCQDCAGKGTVAGQRCDCVEQRLRQGLELASDLRRASEKVLAYRLPGREALIAHASQVLLDIADNHPLLLLEESTR